MLVLSPPLNGSMNCDFAYYLCPIDRHFDKKKCALFFSSERGDKWVAVDTAAEPTPGHQGRAYLDSKNILVTSLGASSDTGSGSNFVSGLS